MINTFDYSAVNNYMNEQVKRESEKTRSQTLQNDRVHVLNQGLKWSLICLGIGLALYIALSGVGNALSFKQVKENITSTFSEIIGSDAPSKESLGSEDVILDVDSLLENAESFPITEQQNETESVRNYVIFDKFDISIGNVSLLWIGRNYPDANSPSDRQWCYADINSSYEADLMFTFISADESGRTVNEINADALKILGLSYDQAITLRNKCGI